MDSSFDFVINSVLSWARAGASHLTESLCFGSPSVNEEGVRVNVL